MEKEFQIRYRGRRVHVHLDDIIFIKVERKECIFYLSRTIFPHVTITLKEVLERIKEVGEGYEHCIRQVGRKYIINLKYLIHANPQEGTVIIRRDYDNTPVYVDPDKPKAAEKYRKKAGIIQTIKATKEQEEEKTQPNDHVLFVGYEPSRDMEKYLEECDAVEVLKGYATQKKLTCPIELLNGPCTLDAGHIYVDLGLPSGTLWSAYNLGEYNNGCHSFYAWGALYESDSYDLKHYNAFPKHDIPRELDLDHDIARKAWGGNWRIPTYKEFQELAEKCTITWCAKPKGCLVKGPNGNKIFLPANGYKKSFERNELMGLQGCYWTNSAFRLGCATSFQFKEDDLRDGGLGLHSNGKIELCYGLSMRPVMSKSEKSHPEKEKRNVLIINSYRFDLNSPFYSNPWNPEGWNVDTKTILGSPDEVLHFYKEYCVEKKPDVIVSVGSASFICKQLKGYPRICLNPNYLPSDDLAERKELIKNPAIPQALIDEYRKVEKNNLMARGDEKCVVVYGQPDDDEVYPTWDDPALESWERIDVDPWASPHNWMNTFLYPLIEKMAL